MNDYHVRWARPFVDLNSVLHAPYFRFVESTGGIIVQTSTLDKDVDTAKYVNIKSNFPFELFIFRTQTDFDSRPLPWLQDFEPTQTYMQFKGAKNSDGDLRAVKRTFASPGTVVTLGGNSEGYPVGSMTGMYAVVVKMIQTVDPPPYNFAKDFDRYRFFELFWQFAIVDALFFAMVIRFLHTKVNMRLDRIAAYLCGLTHEGPERTILAGLLLCRDDMTPNDVTNAQFRRNIFWAQQSIRLIVAVPFVALLAFGICCASMVEPRALGFSLVLVGYPLCAVGAGFYVWQRQGWRMTRVVLGMLVVSFTMVQIFCIMSVFIDPAVLRDGEPVDIFSITTVFLTLNTLPMMAIAYINDPALAKSVQALTAMLSSKKKVKGLKNKFNALGSMGLKMRLANASQKGGREKKEKNPFKRCFKKAKHRAMRFLGRTKKQPKTRSKSEASLMEVLGEEYTISSEDPTFRFANPIDSAVSGSKSQRRKRTIGLYLFAVFQLVLYIAIVERNAAPKYSQQPYGISLWVLVLDFCMWIRMRRGTCDWGPGKTVMLIALTRGAIALFSGDLWLVSIGASFFIVGNVLAIDIVNTRLRTLSAYEIGAIAFFGNSKTEAEIRARNDYASTPEWTLCTLSFFYLCPLFYVILRIKGEDVPTFQVSPRCCCYFDVVFCCLLLFCACCMFLRDGLLIIYIPTPPPPPLPLLLPHSARTPPTPPHPTPPPDPQQ